MDGEGEWEEWKSGGLRGGGDMRGDMMGMISCDSGSVRSEDGSFFWFAMGQIPRMYTSKFMKYS